jgi:hypothetical protein
MSVEPREGQKKMKKVALLGYAPSWKLAPFDDPEVEIFSLNDFWKYTPRWDRWFEVHDADTLGISKRDLGESEVKRHLDWLKAQPPGKPIYMQAEFCDGRFPAAVPLPLDRLTERFGRYFTSTIGMMIGMAIIDDYEWIGLYGIDLASDVEYQDQRPNAEYLVGYARGQGRTVVIPDSSAMCKAGHVYGIEKPLVEVGGIGLAMSKHKQMLEKKHHETLAVLNTLDGAIQVCENVEKILRHGERGVQVG